ncbi:hypothetical protein HYU92_01875 [Candidatus Curtissbacteria bacterium]|nr:hypothetical protein [Candidatus Curtissbacteria bacterium]
MSSNEREKSHLEENLWRAVDETPDLEVSRGLSAAEMGGGIIVRQILGPEKNAWYLLKRKAGAARKGHENSDVNPKKFLQESYDLVDYKEAGGDQRSIIPKEGDWANKDVLWLNNDNPTSLRRS